MNSAMQKDFQAQALGRLSGSIEVLRRGMGDRPTTWSLVVLRVAEHPGCSVAWLAENVGLSPSVVNRVLQELGPEPSTGRDAVALIDSIADPVNIKRKLYLLTEKGSEYVEQMLSTAFGTDERYRGKTSEAYRSMFEASEQPPRVKTDHFSQAQLARIRTAASRRYEDFAGENFVAFPLKPAEALIGQQQDANGESYDGLSGWVEDHHGRWFEMPTIYPADGGVALADFDDPNAAFHFVLRWRGGHER